MGYNTNEERLLNSSKLVLEESLGKCGGQVVSSTTVTGKFIAITPVTECVVTTQGNLALSGITLPAGLTVYGYFTSVQIASGDTAIVYKACE